VRHNILFTATLLIFSLSFLQAGHVATEGAKVGKWTMDVEAAFKLAKEKNLPIFMHFTGSDWCYWCILMEKSIFSKAEWNNYAKDNLVLVTLDYPKDQNIVPAKYRQRNKDLAQKHGVGGYPTYVLLDSDAKTELGRLGAGRGKTPQSFQAEVASVLRMRASAIETKVASLSPEQGKKYKQLIVQLKMKKAELDAWLKTGPTRTEENVAKFNSMNEAIAKIKEQISKF